LGNEAVTTAEFQCAQDVKEAARWVGGEAVTAWVGFDARRGERRQGSIGIGAELRDGAVTIVGNVDEGAAREARGGKQEAEGGEEKRRLT